MIDIENFQTEIQSRADALTSATPRKEINEVGIAARSVELAGGVFDRTVLNAVIQEVLDTVDGDDTNAQLIALGAMLPRTTAAGGGVEVGTYVQGLFGGNPKYLRCDGSSYLRSAYPDLTDDMLAGVPLQINTSAVETTNISGQSAYENQQSVYKFGGKYYKLTWGNVTSGVWSVIPILSSTDGVSYTPVAVSVASPIISANASVQMDVMLENAGMLLAFGRMRTGSSDYLVQLRSLDSGVTWLFTSLRTSTVLYTSESAPVIAAAVGQYVIAHECGSVATAIYYSNNFGASYAALSDADVVNGAKYINGIAADGTRFMIGFTDGSSAYSASSDPSGSTWTGVSPPNVNARGVIEYVGAGKWIMGGVNGYVATCTSLGTWVAETTCTTSMPTFSIDRIRVNGGVIAFSRIAAGDIINYCVDAGTLPAVTAVVADAVLGTPASLRLASVADGLFYVRTVGNSLLSSASLASGSFAPAQVGTQLPGYSQFSTSRHGLFTKYSKYFLSVVNTNSSSQRFVSTDMRIWRPMSATVFYGCGSIIDAGSRLLALDSNHMLWQSTDGETWDTAGITRPSLFNTPYSSYARLYICENGWVYFVRFFSSAAQYQIFVSKDSGATWNNVTGLNLAGSGGYTTCLDNPFLFTSIDGVVLSLSVNYNTSGYGYVLSRSSNGIAFSATSMNAADALTGAVYERSQCVLKHGSTIYAGVVGGTAKWFASYDGGATFLSIPEAFVPSVLRTLTATTSYMLVERLTTTWTIWYTTNSFTGLLRLTGPLLTASSSYVTTSATLSPHVLYAGGELNVLAPVAQAGAGVNVILPRLFSLDDANATFTLNPINNTWLRAVA